MKKREEALESSNRKHIEEKRSLQSTIGAQSDTIASRIRQIEALNKKIEEVCKHNDECRAESKKSWEEAEELKQIRELHLAEIRRLKDEIIESNERYRRAAEEFGKRMHDSGVLRKPAKQLSINLHAIATEHSIEDISSMSTFEAKKLGTVLVNILNMVR